MSQLWRGTASLVDPRNPIINALGHTFGGYLPGRKRPVEGIRNKDGKPQRPSPTGIGHRVDVVNDRLCDDLLKYLAPTLEEYKGCTIVDINPGACVWSAKLNDFLKPKQHLLMEPEERYVEQFIQPLLDMPGSSFQHTPLPGNHPSQSDKHFKQMFSQGGTFAQHSKSPEDLRLRQLDTSLLVTGNLARTFAEISKSSASARFPSVILYQFCWASLANQLVHAGGLARMLWWVPDPLKTSVLPQNTAFTSSLGSGLQLCARISEVAGVETIQNYRTNLKQNQALGAYERGPVYARQSAERVWERMLESKMHIPKDRAILSEKDTGANEEVKMRSPLEIRYNTRSELLTAVADFKTYFATIIPTINEVTHTRLVSRLKELIDPLIDGFEFPQCAYFSKTNARNIAVSEYVKTKWARAAGDLSSRQARFAAILDLRLRIISLEAHCKAVEENGEDVSDLKDQIITLDNDLHVQGLVMREIQDFVERTTEDHLAFFADPPLLGYDRRPYEPLKATNDDFWPHSPLTLLDVVPNERDLTVPDIAERQEVALTSSALIKFLSVSRTSPLPAALDKIAPNAAQDLIPQVPAITDPRKGGRLNPENVRVRMLSDEMIEGLTKAWFEWPFKPESWQLELATNSHDIADAAEALTPEAVTGAE